ncbi:hypothetical protein HJFPF1_11974 [Paramyrothecium foliicola]|nr:hypothetical protein HJFPF1_11974 [Paramyrothecium foliicola]
MYFTRAIAALGLFAAATQACNPGQFSCGNQNGAPGPDGAVYSCNGSGNWVFSAQCGGRTCCNQQNTNTAFCIC